MRWGTTKLAALGIVHDPHSPGHSHPPLDISKPVGPALYVTSSGNDEKAEEHAGAAPPIPEVSSHPSAQLHALGSGSTLAYGGETGTETEERISTGSRSEVTIVEKGKETHVHHDHQHHHHHHHPPSHAHDLESGHHPEGVSSAGQAISQLVGIAILEFGVLLHSFLIGLTLAVTQNFKVLFVVIVFHRMSRLLSPLNTRTHVLLRRNLRRTRCWLTSRLRRFIWSGTALESCAYLGCRHIWGDYTAGDCHWTRRSRDL